jgi:hypothetical protein
MEPVMTASATIGALTEAVCCVMSDVGVVQKTGKNTHGRYSYASELDLLAALQPAMARHGLAIMLVSVDGVGDRSNGKADVIVLRCTYRLAHKSGEWMLVQSLGTGMNGDKAEYAAMTGAYKYALRQTFAVPTGDDPDADARSPHRAEAPAQAAPPPPTTTAERNKIAALTTRIKDIAPPEDVRELLRPLVRDGAVSQLSLVVQRLDAKRDATAADVAAWIKEHA